MKRYLPFILPAVVVALLGALLIGWYRRNTQAKLQPPTFAEGVVIEPLIDNATKPNRTATNVFSEKFMAKGDPSVSGVLRYEFRENRVAFTVEMLASEPESGWYQVWIRSTDGKGIRKAFRLSAEKGGYMGSAQMQQDILPVSIVVSRETTDDDQLETELLEVSLEKNS